MRKIICILVALALATLVAVPVHARQTIEEATDSVKNIMALAKGGDAKAQNEVGLWYYEGRHQLDRDYKEALQWWSRSAGQGNPQAIGNMGLCYETGHGVPADSLKASELYLASIRKGNKALLAIQKEQARKGSVFSDMLLATCWQKGIGVTRDQTKALPYLEAAASKNCVKAQRDLGLALLNLRKPGDAYKWFRMGAANGDLTSTFYCGKMLLEGLGVKQDKERAVDFLRKAAEAGFPQAMFYMGNCCLAGNGIAANPEQVVAWYRRAAVRGSGHAQYALAGCLREGRGTSVDFGDALFWYAQASTKGYRRAVKNLLRDTVAGSPFAIFVEGMKLVNEKKYDAALEKFVLVEKADFPVGRILQARIYLADDNPEGDAAKAVKLLKREVKTEPSAQLLMGLLYEAGKGVKQDKAKGLELIEMAVEAGYAPAECGLGDRYFEGLGVPQSYEKAVALYAKALEQGQISEDAARHYAACYENGWGGLAPDKEKAAEILKANLYPNVTELLKQL